MWIVPNRRINVDRMSAPAGLEGATSLQRLHSDVRIWLRIGKSFVVAEDGIAQATDATARWKSSLDIRENDVVSIVNDTAIRYFRVGRVDEIWAPSGHLVGYRANLDRDTALEGA